MSREAHRCRAAGAYRALRWARIAVAVTLRPRVIDIGQVTRVHRRTSYSPVRVDLDTGETVELPGVKPEDLEAVRALLPSAG